MSFKQQIRDWFFKRTLKGRIFLSVLSFHLLFLLFCQLNAMVHTWLHPEPIKKHVIVSTVKLKSVPVTASIKTNSKELAIASEMTSFPAAKEKPKTETKPKILDKKPTPAKKTATKKAEPTKATKSTYSPSEVQKALKSLEAIQSPSPQLTNFNAFSEEGEEILDESQRLAVFIRTWLKLPEFGKVTVRVKFNKEGKILSLETLSSESQINQKYVEQNLCLLTLPVAKNEAPRQSERSLVLVLSNE